VKPRLIVLLQIGHSVQVRSSLNVAFVRPFSHLCSRRCNAPLASHTAHAPPQPDRADSVRNFLAMVGAVNGLFSVNVIEKFDDDVWDQHLSNLADDAMKEVYDPALHMPKVIVLTKVREFDEEVDGAVLRETREEREVEKERVREAKKKERLNK